MAQIDIDVLFNPADKLLLEELVRLQASGLSINVSGNLQPAATALTQMEVALKSIQSLNPSAIFNGSSIAGFAGGIGAINRSLQGVLASLQQIAIILPLIHPPNAGGASGPLALAAEAQKYRLRQLQTPGQLGQVPAGAVLQSEALVNQYSNRPDALGIAARNFGYRDQVAAGIAQRRQTRTDSQVATAEHQLTIEQPAGLFLAALTGRRAQYLRDQEVQRNLAPGSLAHIRSTPELFDIRRLGTKESIQQLTFAGLFGGVSSAVGGAALGSTPLGGAGVLLGSVLGQKFGVENLFKPLAANLEKAAEAGLEFERAITGITASFQATSRVVGPGGREIPFDQQVAFQRQRAIAIQSAARPKLLELGIGGQTEATLLRTVVAGFAQRGINLSPDQATKFATRLGGTIGSVEPSLLQNQTRLQKDTLDLILGSPRAGQTSVGLAIGGANLAKLRQIRSGEDIDKATASMQSFVDVLNKIKTPDAALRKLDAAFNNLQTVVGDKFLNAITPALFKLGEALSDEKFVNSITAISLQFADLASNMINLAPKFTEFVEQAAKLAALLGKAVPDKDAQKALGQDQKNIGNAVVGFFKGAYNKINETGGVGEQVRAGYQAGSEALGNTFIGFSKNKPEFTGDAQGKIAALKKHFADLAAAGTPDLYNQQKFEALISPKHLRDTAYASSSYQNLGDFFLGQSGQSVDPYKHLGDKGVGQGKNLPGTKFFHLRDLSGSLHLEQTINSKFLGLLANAGLTQEEFTKFNQGPEKFPAKYQSSLIQEFLSKNKGDKDFSDFAPFLYSNLRELKEKSFKAIEEPKFNTNTALGSLDLFKAQDAKLYPGLIAADQAGLAQAQAKAGLSLPSPLSTQGAAEEAARRKTIVEGKQAQLATDQQAQYKAQQGIVDESLKLRNAFETLTDSIDNEVFQRHDLDRALISNKNALDAFKDNLNSAFSSKEEQILADAKRVKELGGAIPAGLDLSEEELKKKSLEAAEDRLGAELKGVGVPGLPTFDRGIPIIPRQGSRFTDDLDSQFGSLQDALAKTELDDTKFGRKRRDAEEAYKKARGDTAGYNYDPITGNKINPLSPNGAPLYGVGGQDYSPNGRLPSLAGGLGRELPPVAPYAPNAFPQIDGGPHSLGDRLSRGFQFPTGLGKSPDDFNVIDRPGEVSFGGGAKTFGGGLIGGFSANSPIPPLAPDITGIGTSAGAGITKSFGAIIDDVKQTIRESGGQIDANKIQEVALGMKIALETSFG